MGHREAILDAATPLFYDQGFSRTTTDEIAAGAHITKRTLYRYFSSKEAILLAVHEEVLGRLLGPVDLPDTATDRFTALLGNYIDTVVSRGPEIQVFFEERKHLSPASLKKIVDLRDQQEEVFRATIRNGISESAFRELDVPFVAEAILGAVASMYTWYRRDGELTPTDVTAAAADMFLHGLPAAIRDSAGGGDRGAPGASARPAGADLPVDYEEKASWDTNPVLNRILDAAAALFYERGYDMASTRELADAAQLTKSALYYYVPNKESILFQLNLRLTVDGIESLKAIRQKSDDPVTALHDIFLWQCHAIATNLGALRALSDEMRFLDAEHYNQIRALRGEYTRLFSDAVRAATGAESGDVRGNVLGLLLLGMLNFMHHWYTPAGRLDPAQIGEAFFDLSWRGIAR